MKILSFFTLLILLFVGSASAQQDAQPAERDAVRLYPELGVSGSPMNQRFLAALQQARNGNDPVLQGADWPLVIAKRVAAEMAATPPPGKTHAAGAAAPALDRKTIILIDIPWVPFRKSAVLFKAWDGGLGCQTDIVCSCNSSHRDTRSEVAAIKIGQHAWMSPSAEELTAWASAAGETDKNVRWLFYDMESWNSTPGAEKKDPVKTVRKLHKLCAEHGWKLALIPSQEFGKPSMAPYCDAIILQCQRRQNAATVKFMRSMAKRIRAVNPKCLVGAQLGAGDPKEGCGGTDKAIAFYNATHKFLDLYSVWWKIPDTMIELFKKLDAK